MPKGSRNATREFKRPEELVRLLRSRRAKLARELDERPVDLEEIIRTSVTADTFRGFPHLPARPSRVFRGWARGVLPKRLAGALRANSRELYDAWLETLSADLRRYWRAEMGSRNPMRYGPSRKLTDLLMKQAARWTGICEPQRRRLIRHLHVPLDKHTLAAIGNCIPRRCAPIVERIPRVPQMGFVRNKKQYDCLQRAIRELTAEARVPPIYLDLLVFKPGA